ncbi:hypothetical protein PV08_09711 [Exophiala spinifera]|uniref:Cep57 centrosome microtubule-binding domain-containing protein n=1 Tax=Exophiala spinifera TaxID=91928 RepID=A0A0D2BMR8_9EURO|nr:uncharacterized protein PV08_09711 [Exophiala spinifera]KIW12434.1 hypothetical protein PV08_09711 [Exophiala spinifera]
MPSRFDQGTVGTGYSSIHSADAFVGDYQVMYTPGNSPPSHRPQKKSTRFSRAVSSKSQHSQSIMLPTNIPNTSQILADNGSLPNVQIHYTIPADEKQIVASLRTLQRDLNEAMNTINTLTRERDEALLELRMLQATSKKSTTPASKNKNSARVEEELFDLSRSLDSPKRSPARRTSTKSGAPEPQQDHAAKTTDSNDARVLSPVAVNRPASPVLERRTASRFGDKHKKPALNDTENSMMEDPTAASNTSRRRRRVSLDENMTSAYIIPDITVSQPIKEAKSQTRPNVSKEAQSVLHGHDPEHIEHCVVCRRLTATKKTTKQVTHAVPLENDRAVSQPRARTQSTQPEDEDDSEFGLDQEVGFKNSKKDFTAQITQLMKNVMLEEPTLRPKLNPHHALANVKKLLTDQFLEAKRKHAAAWQKYDAIDAPLHSKRHAAAGEEMLYWSTKMEQCRVNLDQLRDVEEGMRTED